MAAIPPPATLTRTRWMSVGHSRHDEAAAAAAEAASTALEGHDDVKLLIVFCSDAYDLPALLAAVNERSGGAPLIGCTTAGEISSAGPADAGVVITALGGEGFTAAVAAVPDASRDLRGAGARAAACIEEVHGHPHQVLVLLTDGLGGDQQEIVRGAHGTLGASVPLVGGCAGDGLKMKRTFQFAGTEVLTDGVVAAALGSDAPLGIGVHHGWSRVGEPMLVTRAHGNRVFTLDDQPALDVYLERLSPPPAAHHDPDAFTQFALTHPLGLSRRSGEDHARFISDAGLADGSLGLIADVPQGGLVWLMEGSRESVLGAADAAVRSALEPLEGRAPLGAIAFDCIARRGVLGEDGIHTEVAQVSHALGDAPLAGFYTYGEIARTRGMSGFHNQTLVILAVS